MQALFLGARFLRRWPCLRRGDVHLTMIAAIVGVAAHTVSETGRGTFAAYQGRFRAARRCHSRSGHHRLRHQSRGEGAQAAGQRGDPHDEEEAASFSESRRVLRQGVSLSMPKPASLGRRRHKVIERGNLDALGI
jgi:hypothetical protein